MLCFGRWPVKRQAPNRRHEIAERILGIKAAFDRPAIDADILLGVAQWLASRNADHFLDKIQTGDQLGDRMFDLKPGVHF